MDYPREVALDHVHPSNASAAGTTTGTLGANQWMKIPTTVAIDRSSAKARKRHAFTPPPLPPGAADHDKKAQPELGWAQSSIQEREGRHENRCFRFVVGFVGMCNVLRASEFVRRRSHNPGHLDCTFGERTGQQTRNATYKVHHRHSTVFQHASSVQLTSACLRPLTTGVIQQLLDCYRPFSFGRHFGDDTRVIGQSGQFRLRQSTFVPPPLHG